MKIQIDTGKMKDAVSLDQIVELIFNNAAEEQAPSDFDREEIQSLDDMVEELAAGLTDTILCVNLDYFKQGMKFGARLLLELTA